MKDFFFYGEKVDGYDVAVLNEREARAGAGILFAFGLLGLTNSVMLGHLIFTKFFITFFTLDFLIRVIQPRYSPSLLLGRFFVQNQKPEYVGATQKRFAWTIGLLLALPMFYTIVVHFVPNPIKVVVCITCLVLLLLESAFSICVGCKIYGIFKKDPVTHCPGGVCEMRTKDKIQTFSMAQKLIVGVSMFAIVLGSYLFITKVESKTFLAKKIKMMLLTKEELQAIKDAKYAAAVEAFENDDDF